MSNIKHIRIDYAPLNVAVSMERLNAPNGESNAYVFCPIVIATASDGSWSNTRANSLLTDMNWYVNGVEISEHPDWQGDSKYSIDTSTTDTRGAITIRFNVPQDKRYSLHFEGIILDVRLGTRIPIVTDAFVLSTQVEAEGSYSISIGDDTLIRYNPFQDKLLLHDYKVAHGIDAESVVADNYSYIHTIPIHLYRGGEEVTSGYSVKLYRVNSASSIEELTTNVNHEVLSITSTAITLDLRLIKKADYIIKAIIPSDSIANPQIQFSVNRTYPNFSIKPTNGTSILPSDVKRFDMAMVSADGNVVEYPESILKIMWYTDSAYKTAVLHNEGGQTVFPINNTGIGNSPTDDWLDVYCEAEIKDEHRVAVDSGGNTFTDKDGNTYIFN